MNHFLAASFLFLAFAAGLYSGARVADGYWRTRAPLNVGQPYILKVETSDIQLLTRCRADDNCMDIEILP